MTPSTSDTPFTAYTADFVGAPASMKPGAMFYLTVKGQKQGDIKGNVTQKGREGMIHILAWNWKTVSPRDYASGLATGKRQHSPVVFRMPVGKQSPLLANALCSNENLSEVNLFCWTTALPGEVKAGAGAEVKYYHIKLINANLASIEQSGGRYDNQPVEDVAMTFQKIVWTYVPGGIEAEDDWNAPVT
jgi:type VI secretion system secreted protein Hcp